MQRALKIFEDVAAPEARALVRLVQVRGLQRPLVGEILTGFLAFPESTRVLLDFLIAHLSNITARADNESVCMNMAACIGDNKARQCEFLAVPVKLKFQLDDYPRRHFPSRPIDDIDSV